MGVLLLVRWIVLLRFGAASARVPPGPGFFSIFFVSVDSMTEKPRNWQWHEQLGNEKTARLSCSCVVPQSDFVRVQKAASEKCALAGVS